MRAIRFGMLAAATALMCAVAVAAEKIPAVGDEAKTGR
jgi:hypothetical protein